MKRIISLAIMFATLFTLTIPVCAEPQKTKAEIVSEFKTTVQIGTWIPYILTDDGAKTMKENGIDFIFIWWYDNYENAIALCEKYDIKCIVDAGIREASTDDDIKELMNKSYWQSPAVIGRCV